MDIATRFANLNAAIEDGRVCRKVWSDVQHGKSVACLLLQVAPEVTAQDGSHEVTR
jgi:hypothetical protein